jgi:double-stranded uracil-DNA glycosylase
MEYMVPKPPTKAEIQASTGKTVPDVIAPDLNVLFCGINPGLYTAAVGHHFARPGNRFWPALYRAGITPRLLRPDEERELLTWGYGITNVVARATTGADELTADELIAGATILAQKINQYHPKILAILGMGAYRTAFARPKATMGQQAETIAGAMVWVLPNPSGLNAHYTLQDLADLLHALKQTAEALA